MEMQILRKNCFGCSLFGFDGLEDFSRVFDVHGDHRSGGISIGDHDLMRKFGITSSKQSTHHDVGILGERVDEGRELAVADKDRV